MEPDIDRELWIEAEGFEGRSYLVGHSHTFPGRMEHWNEQHKVFASVSKYEITAASEASWRWIEGILVGNEPSLESFLRLDATIADDRPDDDPSVLRWRSALARFHETGRLQIPFDQTE